jgi:hypothetical protein
MPAARPRYQVTPTETTSRLLERLSKLTGKAPATLVRELLDEATPALQMTLDAFDQLAQRPQEMEAVVFRMAQQAQGVIVQQVLSLDTDRKPGRKPRDRGRGAANTG